MKQSDSAKSPSLMDAFKRLLWELKDKHGRFEYLHYMIRELPGMFGMLIRRRFVARYLASCGKNVNIHPGVRFRNVHRLSLGDNVELGVDSFFQAGGGLTIMDNAILGPGVKVWTVNHRFEDTERAILDQGYDVLPVVLGPNIWVGANAFIMPGTELGEGCVVSAGAVVSAKKYPPYSILSGNPARVIGNRKTAKQTDSGSRESMQ